MNFRIMFILNAFVSGFAWGSVPVRAWQGA